MDLLQLPAYDHQIKKTDGKAYIFDIIRKKYIVLTHEEWVRQHFINYLVSHLKFSKSLMKVESGLKLNGQSLRSDIIVYNKLGKPFMVIECKSAREKINQTTIEQASKYNQTFKAKYMVVTNGIHHICYEVDYDTKNYKFMDHIPSN